MFKKLTDEEAFLTGGGGWLTWIGAGLVGVGTILCACNQSKIT